MKSHGSHTQTRFRRDADSTCQSQETTFLTDVLQKKTQILEKVYNANKVLLRYKKNQKTHPAKFEERTNIYLSFNSKK